MRKQKQQGFTLIELVVVIVILENLSAIAVPKFIDLQKQARTAVMYGTQGAVQSAAALAKAAWLAAGGTAAITSVTMDGVTVNVNTSGYPQATLLGIGAAINRSTNIFYGTDAAAPMTGTYTISYSSDGGATAMSATCNVLYTAGTSGTATAAVGGC